MAVLKYCSRCGEWRPASGAACAFYRMSASNDGLQHYCKSCNRAATEEWNERQRAKRAEAAAALSADERDAWQAFLRGDL